VRVLALLEIGIGEAHLFQHLLDRHTSLGEGQGRAAFILPFRWAGCIL